MDGRVSCITKLCSSKFIELDVCGRPLFINLVTYVKLSFMYRKINFVHNFDIVNNFMLKESNSLIQVKHIIMLYYGLSIMGHVAIRFSSCVM